MAGRRENRPVKDIFRMSEKGYLTYEEGKIPMTQIQKKQKEANDHLSQEFFSYLSDSVVYEWYGSVPLGGTVTYYYPEEKRPDTKDDLLSLGFITPSLDAVLVRIDSQGGDMHNDYLQLEIVSIPLDSDTILNFELSRVSFKHVMKISYISLEWWKSILELQLGI